MSEQKNNEYGIELIDSSEIEELKKAQKRSKKLEESRYKALPFEKKILTWRFWKYIVIIFSWLTGLKIVEKYTGFGTVYVALSIFLVILLNLEKGDRKSGEMSAYSIFNDGAKRIIGDNPEGFLQSFGIRTRRPEEDDKQEEKKVELQIPKTEREWMKQVSKMGNKPCYCGSEKKYKKCCYYRELRHQQNKQENKDAKVGDFVEVGHDSDDD